MVLFDQATYDKLLSEAPKYKLITPSILSDRLRVYIYIYILIPFLYISLFTLADKSMLVGVMQSAMQNLGFIMPSSLFSCAFADAHGTSSGIYYFSCLIYLCMGICLM